MSIEHTLNKMETKLGLHPYQKARINNLKQLLRIYDNFCKKNNKGVVVFDQNKLVRFKRVCFMQIGCTFRKLKEYCAELDLNVDWAFTSQ